MHAEPDDSPTGPTAAPAAKLTVLAKLLLALLAGLVLVAGVSFALVGNDASSLSLALVGYVIASALVILLMRRDYPHPWLGLGNIVTVLRMALVAALLAPLLGITMPWVIVVVALSTLSLDGFDGWLARRTGQVSNFGARLDMEVDSALAMILAINIWVAGATGPEILLLGLPRYVFLVAAKFLPWLKLALPESFARKLICVVQVASLIALNIPWFPQLLVLPVVVIVGGALVWSFGRDTFWLWRSRP